MKIQKSKKLIITAAILIMLILCFIGICIFLRLAPEAKFRLDAFITKTFSSARLKENDSIEASLVGLTLEELRDDPRITFESSMMLINEEYLISEDINDEICEYKDSGVYMNTAVCDAYEALADVINERFDTKLFIKSAYRSREEQAEEIKTSGSLAATLDASEHQAGLALDVYVPYYAGAGFIDSEEGRYVSTNGWEQGFIIRYPYYATEITGISYEPWHIRYVGAPHAEIMTKSCMCLEEYIEKIKVNCCYEYNGYLIMRQSADADTLKLPESFESAVISPDNCGNYIITVKY